MLAAAYPHLVSVFLPRVVDPIEQTAAVDVASFELDPLKGALTRARDEALLLFRIRARIDEVEPPEST